MFRGGDLHGVDEVAALDGDKDHLVVERECGENLTFRDIPFFHGMTDSSDVHHGEVARWYITSGGAQGIGYVSAILLGEIRCPVDKGSRAPAIHHLLRAIPDDVLVDSLQLLAIWSDMGCHGRIKRLSGETVGDRNQTIIEISRSGRRIVKRDADVAEITAILSGLHHHDGATVGIGHDVRETIGGIAGWNDCMGVTTDNEIDIL